MKRWFVVLALSVCAPCFSQMTQQQKLIQIDHDIEWYESQERLGTWLLAGGLVSSLVAIPFWLPNKSGEIQVAPAAALQVTGIALAWWGTATRYNAQEYLRLLRVKRYDFTLGPLFLPDHGGALGLNLTTGI